MLAPQSIPENKSYPQILQRSKWFMVNKQCYFCQHNCMHIVSVFMAGCMYTEDFIVTSGEIPLKQNFHKKVLERAIGEMCAKRTILSTQSSGSFDTRSMTCEQWNVGAFAVQSWRLEFKYSTPTLKARHGREILRLLTSNLASGLVRDPVWRKMWGKVSEDT